MDSLEYWREREEAALKSYQVSEKVYIERIFAIYDYLRDVIQKEIDSFYAKYATSEGITMAEAKKNVSELDIEEYERKAAKYVADKDFSAKANAEMRLYNATMKINRLELLKSSIGLEMVSSFDELEKYYGDILTERAKAEFQRLGKLFSNIVEDAQSKPIVATKKTAQLKKAKIKKVLQKKIQALKDTSQNASSGGLVGASLNRNVDRRVRWAQVEALENYRKQAGILGGVVQNIQGAADSIANGSFRNATFSDRIWMYQDLLKASLTRLLSQGLIQGRNPKALAKDLRKLFDVQKYQAERLMRTEMARVQIEAQRQSYEAGGYEQFIFIATLDAKTCETCGALDGKVFNVKDMETALNAPPMHPNCRCSTAAYYDAEFKNPAENVIIKLEEAPEDSDTGDLSGDEKTATSDKEFESLKEYFDEKYGIKIDDEVGKLDFKAVKEALTGIENTLNEFPEAKNYLKKISVTSGNLIMSADWQGCIYFDETRFSSLENVEKAISKRLSSASIPTNTSVSTIGAHEVGHILEKALIETSGKYSLSESITAWNKSYEATRVVSKASTAARKTDEGIKSVSLTTGKKKLYTIAELKTQVSTYALKNMSECMAECVGDYMANGENASILSKEVWKILKEELS